MSITFWFFLFEMRITQESAYFIFFFISKPALKTTTFLGGTGTAWPVRDFCLCGSSSVLF